MKTPNIQKEVKTLPLPVASTTIRIFSSVVNASLGLESDNPKLRKILSDEKNPQAKKTMERLIAFSLGIAQCIADVDWEPGEIDHYLDELDLAAALVELAEGNTRWIQYTNGPMEMVQFFTHDCHVSPIFNCCDEAQVDWMDEFMPYHREAA